MTYSGSRDEIEQAVLAIYGQLSLPCPSIVWTHSALANVFAKAALDIFTKYLGMASVGYSPSCSEDTFRAQREQAIDALVESDWIANPKEAGVPAWDSAVVFTGETLIYWEQLPPSDHFAEASEATSLKLPWHSESVGDLMDLRKSVIKHYWNDRIIRVWTQHYFASLQERAIIKRMSGRQKAYS